MNVKLDLTITAETGRAYVPFLRRHVKAAHALLNFEGHPSGSLRQRARNPECYTSYAADLYGFTPFDESCPPI